MVSTGVGFGSSRTVCTFLDELKVVVAEGPEELLGNFECFCVIEVIERCRRLRHDRGQLRKAFRGQVLQ